jgi:DNA-binding MarR family transcriptional regulator
MSAAPELSDQQASEHPIVGPLRRRDARALPMAGGRAANLGELMSDLVDAAALSLSGMTRIINRLQDLGLVQREQCAEDGRGRRDVRAVLTDAGFERLREAWPACAVM